MSELKPCPFCGNSPKINKLTDEYKQSSFAISCNECGCSLGLSHDTNWLGHLLTTGDFCTESDAIAAWNSRPSPWVSVDDRLPEDYEVVFISMDTGLPEVKPRAAVAWIAREKDSNDYAWVIYGNLKLRSPPEFWMSVPEPPKA